MLTGTGARHTTTMESTPPPPPRRPPDAPPDGPGLRFTVAGTPVRIEPSFLVFATVLGIARADAASIVSWVVVVVVSVLAHEFGHAVALRAFGARPWITLQGLTGLTHSRVRLGDGQSLAVSLAGPAVGIGVGAALLALTEPASGAWGLVRSDLVFVNLGWGVLNLAPILPLDGGAVMATLLGARRDPGRARLAAAISIGVAAVAALAALSVGWTFAALLAGLLGWSNVRRLQGDRDREAAVTLREAAARLPADPITAARLAEQVRQRARSDRLVHAAGHVLAAGLLADGRPGEAGRALHDDRACHDVEEHKRLADAIVGRASGRDGQG